MNCTGDSCAIAKYLLFSWWKCGKCKELKSQIGDLIRDGSVIEIDVSKIPENSSEMNMFRTVSPDSHTPALAVVAGNRLVGSYVGKDKILNALQA